MKTRITSTFATISLVRDPGINQFFHSVAEETGLVRHHDNAVEIIVEFAALLGVTADEVFSSEKWPKIRMFVRDELQLP